MSEREDPQRVREPEVEAHRVRETDEPSDLEPDRVRETDDGDDDVEAHRVR